LRAIVILAGGRSSRFGRDKALADFGGKPLIGHVVGKLRELGDECIVSIGATGDPEYYRRALPDGTLVVRDNVGFQGPLAGFVTALNNCRSGNCFLGACDMPFIEPKVVEYLFGEGSQKSGAIPKWRDGRLEPLHAVYDCNEARHAYRQITDEQVLSMISLVDHMPGLRFVNVEQEVAQFNSTLNTFRNLNTPRDLQDAERALG